MRIAPVPPLTTTKFLTPSVMVIARLVMPMVTIFSSSEVGPAASNPPFGPARSDCSIAKLPVKVWPATTSVRPVASMRKNWPSSFESLKSK